MIRADAEFRPPPRRLRGLSLAVVASLALHLILIAILSLIVFQPKILALMTITDLIQDDEQADFDLSDTTMELAEANPAMVDSDPLQVTDFLPTGGPSEIAVTGPASTVGASRELAVSGDPLAGFSATAAGRLKKNASAKPGDYEIALFWDGPSDLDLHVLFHSSTGRATRVINFLHRGAPTTGFLDLDQNADEPYNNDPIEHVRWNTKKPPPGLYQVGVHGYAIRSFTVRKVLSVPFTVEIKSPDGVKSYSGSVGQGDFDEIDTLAIGFSQEQQQSLETQAERLLTTAKEQWDSGDERAKITARGILKNVERRFPTTKSAAEARELLRNAR